jgi:hypothetical protein
MGDVENAVLRAFRWTRGHGRERFIVRLLVVGALVAVVGLGMYHVSPRDYEPSAVGLEMAGDQSTFLKVLDHRGPSISGGRDLGSTDPGCGSAFEGPCSVRVDLARQALHRDYWFIASYVFTALVLCLLGAASAKRSRTKTLLYAVAWAAALAGAADVVENLCLDRALRTGASPNAIRSATIAATTKWSLAPIVLAGALVGLFTYLFVRTHRLAPDEHVLDRKRRWTPPEPGAWVCDRPGICFSGGGIRSGSFCLGVMQGLEAGDGEHGSAFAKARYLASVSGGGYMAGAAQLHASLEQHRRVVEARAECGDDVDRANAAEAAIRAEPVAPPFPPGSAEEDHLRRHGNYLADSAPEWFNAIAQTLGKLLANLGLTALAIVALSQPLGWIGRLLLGAKPAAVTPVGNFPHFPVIIVIALALLAVPAITLATARRHSPVRGRKQNRRQNFRSGTAASLAIALGGAGVVLATTAFVLPLLNGLGKQAAGLVGHPSGVIAAGWPAVLLTGLLARLNTKAMKREGAGGAAPADPKAAMPAKTKKRPNLFIARNLTELIAGPVIALVLLAYLTALAGLARAHGPEGVLRQFGSVKIRDWYVWAAATAIFFAVVFTVDAVSWSMHRFYKRRLWSAFTYDRARRGERDWSTSTRLSEHGKQLEGRPELVLCGAAEVSGASLAPPGHRAVSWTFGPDWVGGPEIGWCPAEVMERELENHNRVGDISMFGAVAISGAAFGSAMGRQSKGTLNSVFALSNARLGVWLPNPTQLRDHNPPAKSTWSYRRHTLTYLIREIFGRYAPDDRWILVADGGHYDNLGLVELLRRRCTKIVCIDASGDASGAVTTIAEALRNAELELGVTVTIPPVVADGESLPDPIPSPWDVAPGDAELTDSTAALASALKARLARTPIVRGTITYPPEAELKGKTGHLIIGRAVLDPGAPWPVVSYAVGNQSFPNDPTGDQWFNADQFDDYVLLGRHLATRLLSEMKTIGWYD